MRALKQISIICGLLALLTPRMAHGQCPFVSVSQAKATSTVIFGGVVTNIRPLFLGRIVTFAVDAVWQGTAHKQVVIYQAGTTEALPLSTETRYVIFAAPLRLSGLPSEFLSEAEKAGVERVKAELESVELEINDCVSRRFDVAQRDGMLRELGPSYPPE
jgi:hypothetical protein